MNKKEMKERIDYYLAFIKKQTAKLKGMHEINEELYFTNIKLNKEAEEKDIVIKYLEKRIKALG